MRRILFTTIALVILLGTFSAAFAAEPQRVEQVYIGQLGEVKYLYYPGFVPFERVDAYLYRPSTLAGWPFAGGPIVGTWWWTGPDSEVRRQSWPAYQFADEWGYYYAEFMLPRDEVWYPCDFPLQWKCNYILDPWATEYHSPATQPFECVWNGPFLECLDWPYLINPMDTVSPLEVWLIGETAGWIIPFEITGYYWKYSDIP